MDENKKVEVIVAEENEVQTVVEEKKSSFVKKTGKWIKDNGLKVLAVGAGVVVGFLVGSQVAGKSNDCEYVDCDDDTIDADAYVVEEDTDED